MLFRFAILLYLKYTVWHLDSAIIADNSASLSYAQVSFSFQPELLANHLSIYRITLLR